MIAAAPPPQFCEIQFVARALGCSDGALRKWERQHKIPPAIRTVGGIRLYTPEMIEVIRAAREAARDARQVGARA